MTRWQTIQLFVIMVTLSCIGSANAASLIDEGKENFKNKRYYAAEDCFNRALQADPQNQLLHYLLGQTLEQLYDNKAAKSAYTNCFRINPFNTQGTAAKKALIQLNGRIEEQAHTATDTPQTMAKALDQIQRQSAERQGIYILNGNRNAAWALATGNREAAKYNYQTRMTLQSLRNGRGIYNYGNAYSEISQEAAIHTSWLRADAQSQALMHQSQASIAARELANSAANLEILLAEQPRAGVPKLRALGTNLYVRYYGTDDHFDPTPPEDPPIELKATQLKLASLPPLPLLPNHKNEPVFAVTNRVSLSQVLATALLAKENEEEESQPTSLSQAIGAALHSINY